MAENITFEKLSPEIEIAISKEHRFGTDAFLLADFASPRHKDDVIDFCAGCGAVGLIMIRNFKPKTVTAVEIQKSAHFLMMSAKERCGAGLEKFIPINADLREFAAQRQVDLITCNPPYKTVGTGKISVEEAAAVARHELECSVLDVCKSARKNLKFGGRLCICNRPERLADCVCAMRECGIEPKRLRTVHKTAGSPAWLILLEGRMGGKGFMRVEKPLIVYDGEEYSEEMRRIYRLGEG